MFFRRIDVTLGQPGYDQQYWMTSRRRQGSFDSSFYSLLVCFMKNTCICFKSYHLIASIPHPSICVVLRPHITHMQGERTDHKRFPPTLCFRTLDKHGRGRWRRRRRQQQQLVSRSHKLGLQVHFCGRHEHVRSASSD